MPIDIVLVDDHTLFRDGLKSLLTSHDRFRVVAEASTGTHGRPLLLTVSFDVALIDLELPDMSGLELLRLVRKKGLLSPVLILSMHADAFRVREALGAGANGYVVKSASSEELLAAILTVTQGGVYLHRSIAKLMQASQKNHRKSGSLSQRETAILQLVVEGKTNEQIGDELHLSMSTVKAHLRSMFARFGVSDRTRLAAEAIGKGLVQPPNSGRNDSEEAVR